MSEPMDTEEQAIVKVLISMYLDSHAAADGTPCECNACDTARDWGYLPLPHTMAVDSLRLCLDWMPGDAEYREAIHSKFAINQSRRWGSPDADGVALPVAGAVQL